MSDMIPETPWWQDPKALLGLVVTLSGVVGGSLVKLFRVVRRFEKMEEKVAELDRKTDDVPGRLREVETTLSNFGAKIEKVDTKMDTLGSRVESRLDSLMSDLLRHFKEKG